MMGRFVYLLVGASLKDEVLFAFLGDLLRDTKWMHEIYVKYAAISSLLYEAIVLAQQSKDLAPFFKTKRKYITQENLHEIVDLPLKRIAQVSSLPPLLNV